MKNLSMKTLITYSIALIGLFGIVRANEVVTETTQPVVSVTGELSTDITFGDATTFGSPYTGLTFSGDGWVLSTNLANDGVEIEEAKYSWSVVDGITLTFGSQAEPYGLAWGLHRPSNNQFVSAPRAHSVSEGVGISTSALGVGVNAFYGNDTYWAARLSYGVSLFGINSTLGLSVNSNDAQLLDVSTGGSALGIPFESSLEYDLANDGAYWLRGVVTPSFAKGAFGLIGYNSDEEVLYGVGYKCSDKVKLATELSDDNDTLIRVSYSF